MKQTKSIRYAINAKDSAVDSIIGPHLFISSFWIKLFGIGMKGHTATRFMGNSYDSYVRCINE